MKQTPIEWLEMEIVKLEVKFAIPAEIYQLCEKAKAMEKEQIEKAYSNGRVDEQFKGTNASFYRTKAEQYYNETYGK